MIQFNLLPDVKAQYIRSQALKRSIVTICVAVTGAALAVLVLLILVVDVFQKQQLSSINHDIKTNSDKLQSIPDLNKVLTIQNQLNSLPALHAKKPVTSRLPVYLSQIVPDKVSISQLTVDFDMHTINFTGGADALSTINQFADTLKFTTYGSNKTPAFSSVVLASFSRTDKGVSYSITTNFDPAIFDSSKDVTLNVPNTITSRSETEKPSELFKTSSSSDSNQGNQ